MYFIRSEAANIHEALGSYQSARLAMQNPGYLNIRFLRVLPNHIRLPRGRVVLQIEPCFFNLVYDKDNASSWYLKIEAASFNSAIYYFPLDDAIASSREIKDLSSTLLHDMRPYKSPYTDNNLMRFLINTVFISQGRVHVAHLYEIDTTAQKPLLFVKKIAAKNMLYILFDHLLREINQPQRTNINKDTVLMLLQIIHVARKKPQLFERIIDNESVNPIQLNKIREKLNLVIISTDLFSFIVTSELYAIFQAVHPQRDHTVAAICCWMNTVLQRFDEQAANAYFCHQVWVALTLANVIALGAAMSIFIISGSSFSLLCGLMFASASLYFAQETRKLYMPFLKCLKDLDLEEVYNTFDNSFSLIGEEKKHVITQICDIFERCYNNLMTQSYLNNSPAGVSNLSFFVSSERQDASVELSKQEEDNVAYPCH